MGAGPVLPAWHERCGHIDRRCGAEGCNVASRRAQGSALKAPWQVWRDASGRLSALRIVALLFLSVPVVIAIYDFNTEGYGARPLNNVIHRTGYWALIFLMVSLAITPLRRIGRFGKLLDVRRMIGVGAFVYAAAHILLYVADQMFDLRKVASEIVLRLYLTIGFVALLGLTALGRSTSTDGMVRRLGGQELAAPAQHRFMPSASWR